MRRNSILYGEASNDTPAHNFGILVIRVFAGIALSFTHGWQKLPPSEGWIGAVGEMGFPAPVLFAWMAGLAEFVGGLLLALGLFTRPAALIVAINMAVASFIAHAGDPWAAREKGMLFLFVAIGFLIAGPGRYALDSFIRSRRV